MCIFQIADRGSTPTPLIGDMSPRTRVVENIIYIMYIEVKFMTPPQSSYMTLVHKEVYAVNTPLKLIFGPNFW